MIEMINHIYFLVVYKDVSSDYHQLHKSIFDFANSSMIKLIIQHEQ